MRNTFKNTHKSSIDNVLLPVVIAIVGVTTLPVRLFAQGQEEKPNLLFSAIANEILPHIFFYDIPIGCQYDEFFDGLKKKGLTIMKQEDIEEDGIFPMKYKQIYLLGELAGNPVSVRVRSSVLMHVVYEVEVVFLEFIDIEEAFVFANRQIADDISRYPAVIKEGGSSGNLTVVDYVGADKRVVSYLCIPFGGAIFRFYDAQDKTDPKDSIGMIDVLVCQDTLRNECNVCIRYYDAAAGKQARAESAYETK